MSKSPKTTANSSKREQEQASCYFCFYGVLCDVRAYTDTVSCHRPPQSGII